MLHILPVLCLIFFVFFVEIQLKKELHQIEEDFELLKKAIRKNKTNIDINSKNIQKISKDNEA